MKVLSLLLFSALPVVAFAQTYRGTEAVTADFARLVYLQQTPDEEIDAQAESLIKSVQEDSRLEEADRQFAVARIYYFWAKNYLFFRNQETIFRHTEMQKKGSFIKLRELYSHPDIIRRYYNRALTVLDPLAETSEFTNDILCLKAAVLSDLCLVNSVGFVIVNGPRLLSYVNRILREAPQHPQTLLLHICSKAYPPGIYGGNPKEAAAYLERLTPQFDSLSESEQFDFLCAQAFARGRMENFQGALQAINEALKIFPTNCYANAVKILLETERF